MKKILKYFLCQRYLPLGNYRDKVKHIEHFNANQLGNNKICGINKNSYGVYRNRKSFLEERMRGGKWKMNSNGAGEITYV